MQTRVIVEHSRYSLFESVTVCDTYNKSTHLDRWPRLWFMCRDLPQALEYIIETPQAYFGTKCAYRRKKKQKIKIRWDPKKEDRVNVVKVGCGMVWVSSLSPFCVRNTICQKWFAKIETWFQCDCDCASEISGSSCCWNVVLVIVWKLDWCRGWMRSLSDGGFVLNSYLDVNSCRVRRMVFEDVVNSISVWIKGKKNYINRIIREISIK